MSSQWGSQKLPQGLVSHELTIYISDSDLLLTQGNGYIIVCKPDHFEYHNSLKLSFTNTRALQSNFDEWESFLEANSLDIFALCETNLDDSIYSGNFSVRCYVPLIWKDSVTHGHGLAVYVKLMWNLL